MAGEYAISLVNVTKQHGAKTVLEDVNLSFFHGAHIGVIGVNGSGKSSLLKILAREDTEFMGQCIIPDSTKVGYLPQEPQLDPSKTVEECVREGVVEAQKKLDRYDEICGLLGEVTDDAELDKLNAEMGRLQDEIDAANLWDLDHNVELAMESLRLPPADANVAPLSGGERRRVALARLLLSNPDILLLDEPTNHLDAECVAWLEAYLKKFKGTLIVVTHDRYFLSNVTEWILELDGGRTYPWKGNYEAWLEQKQALMARLQKQNDSRRKLLEDELRWVHTNPSGRHAKSQARLKRYEELAAQQVDTREEELRIRIPAGPRLGDLVVRATLEVGPTVEISYVDQLRDALDPDKTVYEEITGGNEYVALAKSLMNGRAYCSRFNFKGTDQQKKVGTLSGGERNRVHLAKLLRAGGNLLLLDEPTNDLDVATLRSLEEGLQDFGGCVMVVSHDRYFLDRVATHILAFEGDSKVTWFEGSYSEYHEDRRKRFGDAADKPVRVRFKPIG